MNVNNHESPGPVQGSGPTPPSPVLGNETLPIGQLPNGQSIVRINLEANPEIANAHNVGQKNIATNAQPIDTTSGAPLNLNASHTPAGSHSQIAHTNQVAHTPPNMIGGISAAFNQIKQDANNLLQESAKPSLTQDQLGTLKLKHSNLEERLEMLDEALDSALESNKINSQEHTDLCREKDAIRSTLNSISRKIEVPGPSPSSSSSSSSSSSPSSSSSSSSSSGTAGTTGPNPTGIPPNPNKELLEDIGSALNRAKNALHLGALDKDKMNSAEKELRQAKQLLSQLPTASPEFNGLKTDEEALEKELEKAKQEHPNLVSKTPPPAAAPLSVNIAAVPTKTTVTLAEFNQAVTEVETAAKTKKTSPSSQVVEIFNKLKDKIAPTDFKIGVKFSEPYSCTQGVNKSGIAYTEFKYTQTLTIANTNPPIVKEIERSCYVATSDPKQANLLVQKYAQLQADMIGKHIGNGSEVEGFPTDGAKQKEYLEKPLLSKLNKDGSGSFSLSTSSSSPSIPFKSILIGPSLGSISSRKTSFKTKEEEILHATQVNVKRDLDVDAFEPGGYFKELDGRVEKQTKAANDDFPHFIASQSKVSGLLWGTQFQESLKDAIHDDVTLQFVIIKRIENKLNQLALQGPINEDLQEYIQNQCNLLLSGKNPFFGLMQTGVTKERALEILKNKREEIGTLEAPSPLLKNYIAIHKSYTSSFKAMTPGLDTFLKSSGNFLEDIKKNLNITVNKGTVLTDTQIKELNTYIKNNYGIDNKFKNSDTVADVKKFWYSLNLIQYALKHPGSKLLDADTNKIKKTLKQMGITPGKLDKIEDLRQLLATNSILFAASKTLMDSKIQLEKTEGEMNSALQELQNRNQNLVNDFAKYKNKVQGLGLLRDEASTFKGKVLQKTEFQNQGLEAEFDKRIGTLEKEIALHGPRIKTIQTDLDRLFPPGPDPISIGDDSDNL